jgi:hypothetical protein
MLCSRAVWPKSQQIYFESMDMTMKGRGHELGHARESMGAADLNRLENDAMADNATNDFRDDEVPVEAYDEIRRWLSKWAYQGFDLDKRLSAFITLESLNSFVESMLRDSSSD